LSKEVLGLFCGPAFFKECQCLEHFFFTTKLLQDQVYVQDTGVEECMARALFFVKV